MKNRRIHFIKKIKNNIFTTKNCYRKDCWDEKIGGIAILLGLLGYFIQLSYTEKTLDVKSFSLTALILGGLGELMFAIQGIQKKSITITITRSLTFLGFVTFIIIWIVEENKIKNKV